MSGSAGTARINFTDRQSKPRAFLHLNALMREICGSIQAFYHYYYVYRDHTLSSHSTLLSEPTLVIPVTHENLS